jgi:signal transduction histidine kinase
MARLRRLRRQPAASLGVAEERLLSATVGEELRELSAHGLRALAARMTSVAAHVPLAVLATIGLLGAAGVGYLTAANPHAAPSHFAVAGRLAIILTLLGAGVFAQTARMQARIGLGLLLASLFSCVWLLNGSSDPLAFSIGALCTGAAPVVFCYLMLAHPTGHVRSRGARVLVVGSAYALVGVWSLLILTSPQPALVTPLLHCAPDCPRNVLYLGVHVPGAPVWRGIVLAGWLALTAGTLGVLLRRSATANAPVRRVLAPITLAAIASTTFMACFLVAHATGSREADTFGAAYVAIAVAVPVAILTGLGLERLFMGRALADFVDRLAASDSPDVEAVMADALQDPSLKIAYSTGASGTYVDATGAPVAVPPRQPARNVTVIARGAGPVAAVLFDSQLAEQERYVQAAAEAGLMWLQNSRLEAELAASTHELAASRRRLVSAAVDERERIQRDLHDGAQQRLLGMRAKIGLALGAADEEPAATRQMLAELQGELAATLDELRTLANGVYPPVLADYGLGRALAAACRRSPAHVAIDVEERARWPRDVEGAVYFTCVEALQNVAKHAGAHATARLRVWQERGALRFEVRDTGAGFDRAAVDGRRRGLTNMSDRIAAVGGTLSVRSDPGAGTVVAGAVSLGRRPA